MLGCETLCPEGAVMVVQRSTSPQNTVTLSTSHRRAHPSHTPSLGRGSLPAALSSRWTLTDTVMHHMSSAVR